MDWLDEDIAPPVARAMSCGLFSRASVSCKQNWFLISEPSTRIDEINRSNLMTTAEALKDRFKVVMFEQYGTVVDMQKGPFGGTPHQPDIWVDDMKSLADVMV